MGTQRTTNKDILEALEAQTAAIGALAEAISGNVTPQPFKAPAADNVPTLTTPVAKGEAAQSLNVNEQYLNRMVEKAQKHSSAKGAGVVLYARRNKSGEVKLAYALMERYAELRDNGLIGPIRTFEPAK